MLLPVLKSAKQIEGYKKCRLEEDKVVINGRRYGTDNLHQLPNDINEINVFDITSRSNEKCVGFFSALNLLSNFYESRFKVEGSEYLSMEQFIQA